MTVGYEMNALDVYQGWRKGPIRGMFTFTGMYWVFRGIANLNLVFSLSE